MEKNLTTGSVFKNMVLFSLPYLLSYFLQTLYGMADLFIIGQFEGVASTTAVSIGSQVMHMLTVIIVGLAMGTTVSIGQAVGSGGHCGKDHQLPVLDPLLHALHCLGAGCAEHRSKQTYRHRAGPGSRGVPDLPALPHHPLPHGLSHGGRLLLIRSDLRDGVCGDFPQTHVPTAGVGDPHKCFFCQQCANIAESLHMY